VGGQHHDPAALPPGKNWYPLYRRLGGPQDRSGWVWIITPPPGFDPTDHPACSQSVQLSYLAHDIATKLLLKHHCKFIGTRLFEKVTVVENIYLLYLVAAIPGPYLGILRPWAQENPPPPLFVRIQLCVSKNNTKN
jgi:hypothetical protein